jgi:hypothetical protein
MTASSIHRYLLEQNFSALTTEAEGMASFWAVCMGFGKFRHSSQPQLPGIRAAKVLKFWKRTRKSSLNSADPWRAGDTMWRRGDVCSTSECRGEVREEGILTCLFHQLILGVRKLDLKLL